MISGENPISIGSNGVQIQLIRSLATLLGTGKDMHVIDFTGHVD